MGNEYKIKTIDIEDIKIPNKFKNSTPSERKYGDKKLRYHLTGEYDLPIIDKDNNLIDGYITYLFLKDDRIKEIKVKEIKKEPTYKDIATVYIWGVHLNSRDTKQYIWRLTNIFIEKNKILDDRSLIGKEAIVETKFGPAPIKIEYVDYLDRPPIKGRIKKVIKIIE